MSTIGRAVSILDGGAICFRTRALHPGWACTVRPKVSRDDVPHQCERGGLGVDA